MESSCTVGSPLGEAPDPDGARPGHSVIQLRGPHIVVVSGKRMVGIRELEFLIQWGIGTDSSQRNGIAKGAVRESSRRLTS